MNIRSCFFCHVLTVIALFMTSCSGVVSCVPVGTGRLTVMTYNAQTFFDAVETGSEFSEFRGKKTRWSAERYDSRLNRLRETILLAGSAAGNGSDRGPDIVVLEEIENDYVVRDLCNRMPRNAAFKYAVFTPPEKGCAFGSAIVSKYPVKAVTIHSVGGSVSALRPLIEAELDIGGTPLVVFSVHWKSKSGNDTSDTSAMRLTQEALLDGRIHELEARRPGVFWLACGDFNQKIEEFSAMNAYANCWAYWLDACNKGSLSGPAGSYWYDGSWETIDHFFMPVNAGIEGLASSESASGSFTFADFRVVADSPLVGDDGRPSKYELYSGSGYSDHLPLVLTLAKKK